MIRSEIALARKNQQLFFLMVFSHGEKNTHSILIVWKSDSPEKFQISKMTKLLDTRSNGHAPEISLLTTACYLDGWAMVPHLSLTTMTAAGPEIEAMSWERSKFNLCYYYCEVSDKTRRYFSGQVFSYVRRILQDSSHNTL